MLERIGQRAIAPVEAGPHRPRDVAVLGNEKCPTATHQELNLTWHGVVNHFYRRVMNQTLRDRPGGVSKIRRSIVLIGSLSDTHADWLSLSDTHADWLSLSDTHADWLSLRHAR